MSASSQPGDDPSPTTHLRRRITGAVVLVVIAVVLIPPILGDRDSAALFGVTPVVETPLQPVTLDAAEAGSGSVPQPARVADSAATTAAATSGGDLVTGQGEVDGCVVQLGSFTQIAHAERRRNQVREYGGHAVRVNKVAIDGQVYYRTWIGPYEDAAEARRVVAGLKAGIGDGDYATPGC